MLRAVLFDCDGVLLDSESIYLASVSQYLGTLGRKANVEQLAYLVGADIRNITERLKKDFDLEDFDTEELIRGQRELFNRWFYGEKLTPMDGLEEFLKCLREENIRTAVVSSSPQDYVEYVLGQLQMREYFDLYIGREAASRSKPYPDLYLEALRRLNIRPEEAVVLEDSSNGIKAGLAAGCRVIAYKGAQIKQDTSGAHDTVEHYRELGLERLRGDIY